MSTDSSSPSTAMTDPVRVRGWNAMKEFEHRSLVTTPHKLTYSYYLSPDFNSDHTSTSPTLVFCHGFPDDAYMWAGMLTNLVGLSLRIVLLDMLGFGSSSKPTDPDQYRWRKQADSIAQILDKEGVRDNVIPIGHDWGSGVVQRFYHLYGHRCIGIVLLAFPYRPPSIDPVDFEAMNDLGRQKFGYPQFEYWRFLMADDAPRILQENLDRLYEVLHGTFLSDDAATDTWMRELFCVPGAMREYMTASGRYKGFTVDVKPHAKDPELKRYFIDRLSRDGLSGGLCYYKTYAQNYLLEDEKELCQILESARIAKPYLYIGFNGDHVLRTDLNKPWIALGLLPTIEEHVVEANHWGPYEKPQEIASILREWLQKMFLVAVI